MKLRKEALITGVNSYPTMPLNVCVDDAKEVSAALAMPEYGYNVKTLLNEAVTRRQLKEALDTLFRTEADDYLFYFSGHGLTTDVGVYLATVDADNVDTGIELDYLKRLITKVAPVNARVILILDCCHSGAASARGGNLNSVEVRNAELASAVVGLPQDRIVLAACKDDQLAYEYNSLGHGIFTFHLLQGLLGEAADGEGLVSVTGLYEYVSDLVESAGLQTPVFRGDMAGRSILGIGLTPRTRPYIPEENLVALERDAKQHLLDYQKCIAQSFGQLESWKREGHKAACQMLEPILEWFERKLKEYPQLKTRKTFLEQHNAAVQRLSTLSSIDVGTTVTEGEVTERLGAGTFGTVWKVEDQSNNRFIAYKVYHPTDFNEPEKIGRFKRGYDAMRQLDHPYIVRVHKLTQAPLGFYMDYIDGPNLRNFTGTLDEPLQTIPILLTVAETIKHAHARHVIHRDVKPENLILSQDAAGKWHPHLTDFDLAWYSTASRLTKDAFGTVQYSAPEQMATPMAASAHAPTTDAYSFGQLCFYAVTGSDPVPLEYANNYRALEIRLRGGWIVAAAHKFMNLYADCTEHKYNKRPSFDLICDRLFEIIQILRDVSPVETLTESRFIKELIFAMVGISSETTETDNAFVTLSGKIRIEIQITKLHHKSTDLTLDFHIQHPLMLDSASSHEQARKSIFSRLGNAIANFPETRLRHGSLTPFQVYVDLRSIPLNLHGVDVTRAIVSRMIEVLEGV